MILIQTDSKEVSTDRVLDWIFYLYPKTGVQRINDNIEIEDLCFQISDNNENFQIQSEKITIDSNDIKRYWYRRGSFSFNKIISNSAYKMLGSHSLIYIERELRYVMETLDYSLQGEKLGLNKPIDNYTNKVKNLRLAKQAGLKIPNTIICSNFNDIEAFILLNGPTISKPIVFAGFTTLAKSKLEDVGIASRTELINLDDIQRLKLEFQDRKFLPSLFQQYIEKKFELRVFYLNGKFYPMAIFSQQNEKTKIDFRNYDYANPNRCVPYKLPLELEDRIDSFMKTADINCGSLDLIFTSKKEYVFLEVNPIGQYEWLTVNCNYFLDKEIAHYLNQ